MDNAQSSSEDKPHLSQHNIYRSISLDDVKADVEQLSKQFVFGDEERLRNEGKRAVTRLVALHAMINRFAPISRLPDELFVEIFTYVAHTSSPPRMWFWTTHVCRRWREIALHCPRLWTVVDMRNQNHIREWIRRSGTSLLDVEWEAPRADLSDRFSESFRLLRDCERIQSLKINTANISNAVGTFFCLTFPSLSYLRLCNPRREFVEDLDGVLFRGIPRLQVLEVGGVTIPHDCQLFSSRLRILRINHCSSSRLRLNQLLCALQACSSLQELYLDNAGPQPNLPDETLGPVVQLPLRTLFVFQRGTTRTVGPLLSCITFPASARLDISSECLHWRSTENIGHGISHFAIHVLPRIITIHRHVNHIDLIRTSRRAERGSCVDLIGYCPSSASSHEQESCPPWKISFLNGSKPYLFYTRIIGDLGAALSQIGAHVQTLTIQDFDLVNATMEEWRNAFWLFASLHTLSITKRQHWVQSRTVEQSPGIIILAAFTPSSSSRAIVPQLRLLELQCVDSSPPSPQITAIAAQCLRARQAREDISELVILLDGLPVTFEKEILSVDSSEMK